MSEKNIFFSRNKHQHNLHVWTFLFTLNTFVTFMQIFVPSWI